MLSGALLAATGMTASAEAAHANPSTITSLDITRVLPAGSYGGLTYRYVEGGIHGEASAEERVAGLRELAAGRTAVNLPYRRARSRTRGGHGCRRGAKSRQDHLSRDDQRTSSGDGFLLSHRISIAAVQWQTGFTSGVSQSAQEPQRHACRRHPEAGGHAAARTFVDRSHPPPVEIASINDTCDNFSGWEPFSVDELKRRYGA
jgi:hypothetical protein